MTYSKSDIQNPKSGLAKLAVIVALCLAPVLVHAQEVDPAEAALAKMREALRSTMGQLHTAQSELAAAQAAQVELEKKNATLAAKLDKVTIQAAADKDLSTKAIVELETVLSKRQSENEKYREALDKWKAAYAEAAGVANSKEGERASLAAQVVELKRDVANRERNNLEMYKVSIEILDRYEKFGLGTALVAREPFTGIARVKLENQVQEYRDRLLERRDTIGQSPAPVTVEQTTTTESKPVQKEKPNRPAPPQRR